MGVFLFSTLFSGFNAAAQGNWELQGNSGTNPSNDFIGTTDNEDFVFKTNNQQRLVLKNDGRLGLGITQPRGMFELLYCNKPEPFSGGLIVTLDICNEPLIPVNLNIEDMIITTPNFAFTSETGEGSNTPINISLPAISFRTFTAIPITTPLASTPTPLIWARTTGNNGNPDRFSTRFIVMPNGANGIGLARPRAALDVLGSNAPNYPAAIIGSLAKGTSSQQSNEMVEMFNTQCVQFIPRLTQNGFNKIAQTDDQGMFFTDGLGEEGANENSAFIIAPWAQESEAGDIGGLRMDKFGNVELRGDLRATKVKVDAKWWPDFVFAEGYKLRSLAEVEAFIKEHKHLPDVPSEAEVLENGIDLAVMQTIQQQKIEELTLYIIQLQQQINAMQQAIIQLNGK